MSLYEILGLLLFGTVCLTLMAGFPVAFTLGGVSLLFALGGSFIGAFDLSFLGFVSNRIFGVMTNEVLIAVPLFVFMGVMLERSKVAEELLEAMGAAFTSLPGGLGIAVCIVGALLAASTGIVGATVVTMGLLSLPTMLNRGYDSKLATGAICASGTLGQIIPPSIVLVVLGDQISNAYQDAQRQLGNFAPDPVSVGDLFAGTLIPGLMLVGLYIAYIMFRAIMNPAGAPLVPREAITGSGDSGPVIGRMLKALVAPVVLIVAVLGSILAGVATPTEAAAAGAVGAAFLGGLRISKKSGCPIYVAAACLILVLLLTGFVDLRLGRDQVSSGEQIGIILAAIACIGIIWGLGTALLRINSDGTLGEVSQQTAKISAMVFGIGPHVHPDPSVGRIESTFEARKVAAPLLVGHEVLRSGHVLRIEPQRKRHPSLRVGDMDHARQERLAKVAQPTLKRLARKVAGLGQCGRHSRERATSSRLEVKRRSGYRRSSNALSTGERSSGGKISR